MGSDTTTTPADSNGPRSPTAESGDTRRLPLPPSLRLPPDFGAYRFVERLGRGAFGEVFKVWSSGTRRHEAMKVLQFVGSPINVRLEEFQREVRNMAGVPGGQVAHVYHTGVLPDGRPFFTMEYLEGGRIDEFCNRRRKTIEERLLAVATVCDAVQRLHERTLVHCDIKPGNIVVTEDSGAMVPKLVDFGLASLLSDQHSAARSACGTLPYMPPEQLDSRGGDPERRWDIYALGVTLYQLLVDARPIEDFPDPALPPEALAEHIRKTPVPRLVEKVPLDDESRTDEVARERGLSKETLRERLGHPWLEAIVGKALTKRREDRYGSAAEMAHNLRVFASGRRPPIVRPKLRDRAHEFLRDHALAVGSAVTLVVVALLLASAYRSRVLARNESVAKYFAQGCAEAEPALAIKSFEKALELDPGRSDVRLHLAGAYLNSGNPDEAIALASSVSEGDALYAQAAVFAQGIKQFRARTDGDEVVDEELRSRVAQGDEYYHSLTFSPKDARLALGVLDRALERSGLTHADRIRVRFTRAMRYDQVGDVDKLCADAQWLVQAVPDSAAAWNLHGICNWRSARREDALRSYDKALALNSDYGAARRNRGRVNAELGRHEQALKDYDLAVGLDPSLEALFLGARVDAFVALRNRSAARDLCEKLTDRESRTPEALIACAAFWLWENVPARAWQAYDQAIADPGLSQRTHAELRYELILARGDAALYDKRPADAIGDFNAAEALRPDLWPQKAVNPLRRGIAFLLANSWRDAVVDLNNATERMKDDPGRALTYLWLWDIHLAEGQRAEAANALQRATEAAATDPRLARIVSHCAGAVDGEVLIADAANDIKRQAEAYYYLGLASKARGDRIGARGHFEACLQRSASRQVESGFLAGWQLAQLSENP